MALIPLLTNLIPLRLYPKQQPTTTKTTTSPTKKNKVPSYTERCNAALRFSKLSPEERKLPVNKKSMFVPRSTADFDDGGSFPEIHVSL